MGKYSLGPLLVASLFLTATGCDRTADTLRQPEIDSGSTDSADPSGGAGASDAGEQDSTGPGKGPSSGSEPTSTSSPEPRPPSSGSEQDSGSDGPPAEPSASGSGSEQDSASDDPPAEASPPAEPTTGTVRTIDSVAYRDRLIGMWVAECVANWTGLQREGYYTQPGTFLTDESWDDGLEFVIQDPWSADDDTDFEFIYTMTMADLGKVDLSPTDIQQAWATHTAPGQYIWVSNLAAQGLMRGSPGVLPPSTSLLAANDQSLMIDAQLTTEVFGAIAPGMPQKALKIADLPIRTTASGYSAHAAQFHVALYSLAAVADQQLAPRERVLWLVRTARQLIPDQSKTADVIDLVLSDYLANGDANDWERTRDLIAQKFQTEDQNNGYRYLEWYESSVNLGGGLVALLYGEGDLKRTIQIGTLSGWDSDNGTATMGGLLGLILGIDGVLAAFPDQNLSLDYAISATRVGFQQPTYRFPEIADLMMPLVEKAVRDAGGSVSGTTLTLPPVALDELHWRSHNPLAQIHESSVNNRLGSSKVSIEIQGVVDPGFPSAPLGAIADGLEFDYSGVDRQIDVRDINEYPASEAAPLCVPVKGGDEAAGVSVSWEEAVALSGVRFVEGGLGEGGGYWQDPVVEIRVQSAWQLAPLQGTFEPDGDSPYQIHELKFDAPVEANGIRIRERTAVAGFVTVCELDGILAQ